MTVPVVVALDEAAYAASLVESLEPYDAAKQRARLDPAPKEAFDGTCSACSRTVDATGLACSKCFNAWHSSCHGGIAGQGAFVCRFCRLCQRCGRGPTSDKEPLLDCHKCGSCRHVECALPKLTKRPTDVWLCEKCVVCEGCGTREAASWHENCTVCTTCFIRRRQGDCCPVCLCPDKEGEEQLPSVRCGTCLRFVHVNGKCDGGVVTETMWQSLQSGSGSFVCSICSAQPEMVPVSDADLDRKLDERLRALGRIDGGPFGGGAAAASAVEKGGSMKKVASEAKLRKGQSEAGESTRARRAGTRRKYEDEGEDDDDADNYEAEEPPSKKVHSDESFKSDEEEEFSAPGRRRSSRLKH